MFPFSSLFFSSLFFQERNLFCELHFHNCSRRQAKSPCRFMYACINWQSFNYFYAIIEKSGYILTLSHIVCDKKESEHFFVNVTFGTDSVAVWIVSNSLLFLMILRIHFTPLQFFILLLQSHNCCEFHEKLKYLCLLPWHTFFFGK
jgi:hypothetical protein